jgi:alkylation response protein AidB-like acyl-CoA dehydrogenase
MRGVVTSELDGLGFTVELPAAPRAWRDELRAWLDEVVPKDRDERRAFFASGRWEALLLERRLICPAWPAACGGRGLDGLGMIVLETELRRARVRRIQRGMGETLVGPSIIVHGTDEQKERLLPRIIDGTDRYCQGFSEPDAGSDLASLTTRGVVDGDEVVIDGQKVWTSWYTDATHVFTLCRTDPTAPKHQGLSYVLVPVRRPDGSANGVEFRPIRQLTGEQHFAETWFTGARAPLDNVIGGLGHGWRVSLTTLGNERGASAVTRHLEHERMLWSLVDEAICHERATDTVTRQALARLYCSVAILRFQAQRTLASITEDRDPGPSVSIGKMFWSEHQQRVTEQAMHVLGAYGMLAADADGDDTWPRQFLASRSHTIWGGTAEIQRNIVAERVLGLPKEPEP